VPNWQRQLKQAAWWHPVGRAATFALAAVAGAAAVHRGGTDFDATIPIISSMGAWAVSLIRWPPRRPPG
jgi:hypothetical protein